jgi:hypothetical protein
METGVKRMGLPLSIQRKCAAQYLSQSGMIGQAEVMAIGDYIDKHNDHPKPFVWTARASDILEKVKRARAVLDNR